MSRPRCARFVLVFACVTTALAACSPDPIEVEVQPERAQTCDDLIPTGEALAVQLLAALELAPLDVLTGDEPATGELGDLLDKGEQFDTRSDALGCDPAELNAAIMERVGSDLEPNSLAGFILLEIMRGGAGITQAPSPGDG